MSLAQELNLQWNTLEAYKLNLVENVNERLDEIVAYIESSHIDRLVLDQPPVSEELGRRVSEAFASNPHITKIRFVLDPGVAMRDLIRWIASRGTLVHMTSLSEIELAVEALSMRDGDALFPLLLTSTSLRHLHVFFWIGCNDDIMSALARYLGTSSVVTFDIFGHNLVLSQAAFNSLCDGVAESTLQTLKLRTGFARALNHETAAESLAQAIAQSSLEEVTIWDIGLCWAFASITCVQNLDFAFSQIGNDASHLRINQKWKPLLGANIPLGLWPQILEKAHTSPETSHGPAGILFYLLREKPDLVSGTSRSSLGKRKRTE